MKRVIYSSYDYAMKSVSNRKQSVNKLNSQFTPEQIQYVENCYKRVIDSFADILDENFRDKSDQIIFDYMVGSIEDEIFTSEEEFNEAYDLVEQSHDLDSMPYC